MRWAVALSVCWFASDDDAREDPDFV